MCFLVLTFTTCCVQSPKPVPGQTNEIAFMVKPEIRVYMKRMVGGEHNAIVQEILFDDGTALVECMLVDKGGLVTDRHTWTSETEVRHMKVYLATVEGVHWDWKGFAHLPQNMDGTVKTTVGPGFNFDYQKHHETRGKVTAMSDEYFTWSVRAGLQRLVVEAP